MAKFSVYAMFTASKHLGEFEAETAEEAEDIAAQEGDDSVSLCWECSREADIGDCYEFQTEEVK